MKLKADGGGWNPYIAGGLAGLLAVASAYLTTLIIGSTSYLGASTTFVRIAGLLGSAVAPDYVESNEYFSDTGIHFNWQFLFVLGIFIGAFLSSLSDKSFRMESVPPIWKERKGSSILKRAFWALSGGIVAMIGARMASGCPSGHGLSGMMQLSVSAFVALLMFFCVGVFTATVFYKQRRPS